MISRWDELRPTAPNRPICVSLTCSAETPITANAQKAVTKAGTRADVRTLVRVRSTPSLACMTAIGYFDFPHVHADGQSRIGPNGRRHPALSKPRVFEDKLVRPEG